MPFEHHEPISCVTFSLDTEAQISASRANFRRRMLSRRMLIRLAIVAIFFAGGGLVFGILIDEPDPIWLALMFGGEVVVLFPLLCLLFYALLPRRVRRLVEQNPLSSKPVEACWSAAGLSARAANGTSELAWSDFYGWHPAAVGFLLHLNDQHYHVIPAAILSEQQQAGLRAILEGSGLRRL